MASADWEEVKRLAADFQRAQLNTTLQRLSERNCVEIVTKLIELKLLDVVFTNDGKEYITPQHLTKEISDTVYLHGGRINLSELVTLLNVGYNAIESRVLELARTNSDIHFVLGEVINKEYLDQLAEEVNENLKHSGQISISEVTKQYNLPAEFLLNHLVARLGTIIQGQQDQNDNRLFFTEGFLSRTKARIRGTLSAITKPAAVSLIILQNNCPEKLFFGIVDELIQSGRVKGAVSGGRQANKAIFIPEIYSRTQNEWIDNFLKQNGYLEYDALIRLGLSDPKSYCRKRFKDELLLLKSCGVGNGILQNVEGTIEEALASHSWVDIMTVLPTVFSEEDAKEIVQAILKSQNWSNAVILGDSVIASEKFIQNLKSMFDPLIQEKAEQAVQSGAYLQAQADLRNSKQKALSRQDQVTNEKKDRKEERRKRANEGKAGGGAQGRETKTKSTKKKYLRGKNESDDEDNDHISAPHSSTGAHDLEFMNKQEIIAVLKKEESLSDAPDEVLDELAIRLHKSLHVAFQEAARSHFEIHVSSTSGQRRRTHGEVQERLQSLLQNIKQGEKALQHFSSLELQEQLSRYLLKAAASEFVSELTIYIAQDSNVVMETKDLTVEARQKLINDLPPEVKPSLQTLHKTITGCSIEDFFTAAEVAMAACDIVLRKPDKKKEKSVGTLQRQSLLEQLAAAEDAALVLHIAVLLLFHTVTQTVLNASGRFVPQIIGFLQAHLPSSVMELLSSLQDLIIKEVSCKGDPEQLNEIHAKMNDLVPQVREAAITFKSSSQSRDT